MNETTHNNAQPIINCEEIRDLIPAYSIGALDYVDRMLVEATLPDCPQLYQELEDYQALCEGLLLSVPQTAPDVALKDAVLQAAKQSSAAQAREKGMTAFLTHPQARPGTLAAAILLFLLVVSNAFWLIQNETSTTPTPPDNLLRVLGSGPAQRIEFSAGRADNESDGALAWTTGLVDDTWVAWFVGRGLPRLSEGVVYQIWLVREGEDPISIGIFEVDEDGRGSYVFEISEPLGSFDWVHITQEPQGGSPAPTGEIIITSQF